MAQPEIGVIGLKEFIKTLQALGVEVNDLKAAWGRIGNIVVKEAQSRAPKVSGALAGSIRASNAKGGATVRAGRARVPYAAVQHWGWPGHNIEGTYYLTNAADAKRAEVIEAVSDELERLLRQLGLN